VKDQSPRRSVESNHGRTARLAFSLAFFAIVAITAVLAVKFARGKQPGPQSVNASTNTPAQNAPNSTNAEPGSLEVAQALMVTAELDFGPTVPSIAEALSQIERRSEPADHVGRTFAVLDAYGEPTSDGKLLHISMHISAEKPGFGSLVFRRTGQVLWRAKIVLGSLSEPPPLNKRTLLILVDDGFGKSFTIDGSKNPASILEANLKEAGVPLNAVWPDGTDREFTFIYSACGCPVKAMVRRVGDRTVRARDLPVMFPDDPGVMVVINRLMKWN